LPAHAPRRARGENGGADCALAHVLRLA
jgi:hypothetical protein